MDSISVVITGCLVLVGILFAILFFYVLPMEENKLNEMDCDEIFEAIESGIYSKSNHYLNEWIKKECWK